MRVLSKNSSIMKPEPPQSLFAPTVKPEAVGYSTSKMEEEVKHSNSVSDKLFFK